MNNLWSKLGPRERRLAMGAAAALVFFIVTTTGVRAVTRLNELDDTIERLESDLRMYMELDARRVSVEKAYSVVAQQHSSEWTEAEIHNRLRQEIYRLARLDPNAPADNQQNLVEIPIMRQGTLENSGQGYREYKLKNVMIPPVPLSSLVEFLIRLQTSPQSLRIDGLELARSPHSTLVGAKLDVTRTVVAGIKGTEVQDTPAEPERAESWEGGVIEPWLAEGSEITLSPDMNGLPALDGCLKAVALVDGGWFGMTADLERAGKYEVVVEAMATGPAVLRVKNETTGEFFEGSAEILGDNLVYKYSLVFNVSSEGEGAVRIAIPHITLTSTGTQVFVDMVTLRKVSN